jgi:transposase
MVAVMIGIGPHKGSHTAVAIGAGEEPLGKLRVRASVVQAEKLMAWAAAGQERTWAVDGAGGLGHLLAQQLVAAGERVLDVPPKLAARVRLLEAGDTNKNDPNDALSVAIAALRSKTRREVAADGYAAVLKVWSKRHRDLSRARNQVACRLHAVLCELVPGSFSKEITAGQATRVLAAVSPAGAVAQARCELAGQFLEDLRNLDAQLRQAKKKLAAAVRASRTTLTQIFGVGPVIAGTVIGDTGDISRFASRDHFAACNGTAPIEVSSGGRITCRLSLRGNRAGPRRNRTRRRGPGRPAAHPPRAPAGKRLPLPHAGPRRPRQPGRSPRRLQPAQRLPARPARRLTQPSHPPALPTAPRRNLNNAQEPRVVRHTPPPARSSRYALFQSPTSYQPLRCRTAGLRAFSLGRLHHLL